MDFEGVTMGLRLTKITTKTGDKGTTGLGNGERVSKSHQRVVAMGDVDELNSSLGLVLSYQLLPSIQEALQMIQHHLFDVGAELAVPGYTVITDKHVAWLESVSDAWLVHLSPLEDFILPGGSTVGATVHIARAVCRRAERECVLLAETEAGAINPFLLQYLNRLSDLLFVLARYKNKRQQVKDTVWHKTEWNEQGEPKLVRKS